MFRRRLNKNGRPISDAECPKCKADAFIMPNCVFISCEFYMCSRCGWTWVDDDKLNGWYDKKEEKKDSNEQAGAIPLHESNCKWKWMPLSKREYKEKHKTS